MLKETNVTKNELEKMDKNDFEKFSISVNEYTNWKCLEARAYFLLRVAQTNIPKNVKGNRRYK